MTWYSPTKRIPKPEEKRVLENPMIEMPPQTVRQFGPGLIPPEEVPAEEKKEMEENTGTGAGIEAEVGIEEKSKVKSKSKSKSKNEEE